MILLILGVLLWSAAHLMKAAARPMRQSIVDAVGEDKYPGVFALVIVTSLVFMVLGWQNASISLVYAPPVWGRHLTWTAMLISMILFAGSGMGGNIKRLLRHPQLTGVIVWSVGHLFANGDSASIVLFGGIGLWAIAEIVSINKRDGAWEKPEPSPIGKDIGVVVAGFVGYIAIFFAHPYLFGVSPM